jgi:hypothetical protein
MRDFDDIKQTKSIGLLACYCKETTSLYLPWTLAGNLFMEESGGLDNKNHCARWQGMQLLKTCSLSFVSSSAVLINELVAVAF